MCWFHGCYHGGEFWVGQPAPLVHGQWVYFTCWMVTRVGDTIVMRWEVGVGVAGTSQVYTGHTINERGGGGGGPTAGESRVSARCNFTCLISSYSPTSWFPTLPVKVWYQQLTRKICSDLRKYLYIASPAKSSQRPWKQNLRDGRAMVGLFQWVLPITRKNDRNHHNFRVNLVFSSLISWSQMVPAHREPQYLVKRNQNNAI